MSEEIRAEPSFAAIILAHNEDRVIGKTIRFLEAALSSSDAILVVADNCSDDTAQVSEQAGAQVFVRSNGDASGKGAALGWLVDKHLDNLRNYSRC